MTTVAGVQVGAPRLLSPGEIGRAMARLAHEISERHEGEHLLLVGIRTRGVPLAERVARGLTAIGRCEAELAVLDLTDYRDDRPRPERPRAGALRLPDGGAPDVDGRVVVLVDDVFFTGRTVRAALDALTDHGRPAVVELLVLVDRGHRELPMRATYVGKNVPSNAGQRVSVRLEEVDGVDGAWLTEARSS